MFHFCSPGMMPLPRKDAAHGEIFPFSPKVKEEERERERNPFNSVFI